MYNPPAVPPTAINKDLLALLHGNESPPQPAPFPLPPLPTTAHQRLQLSSVEGPGGSSGAPGGALPLQAAQVPQSGPTLEGLRPALPYVGQDSKPAFPMSSGPFAGPTAFQ